MHCIGVQSFLKHHHTQDYTMNMKDPKEWVAMAASTLFNLYTIIGYVLSLLFLVVDTLQVYQEAGPVTGMFWFFTVGPIVAMVKGVLWPFALCGGCI